VLVALIGLFGCGKRPGATYGTSDDRRPVVAASIFPIADAVRQVGGDRVRVLTLLPPGQTPHGYEPTPAQAERLATARLLVVVGLGLDDWAHRSAAAVGDNAPRVLDLGAMLESHASSPTSRPSTTVPATGPVVRADRRDPQAHDHAHHEPDDPHIWLDPIKMIRIAGVIAEALGEVDPAGSASYAANAAQFQDRLRELDRRCAERLAPLSRKEFVTLHAAFGHFAARYGLTQVALRWAHANEAGPKQLERVIAFIKEKGVRNLFAEPQFPVDRLDAIAKQTGVSVDRLDPLGAPGITGHDSYIELMGTNLDTLVEGLSK